MENTFGPHLMMDLVGCDETVLANLEAHFAFLNEVPELIGMTKITQPYVFPYSGLVPQDKGITGIVIIAESHLSIHSFQEKGYTFIDIFSCKPFDTELVIQETIRRFKPTKYEIKTTPRGKEFPRS